MHTVFQYPLTRSIYWAATNNVYGMLVKIPRGVTVQHYPKSRDYNDTDLFVTEGSKQVKREWLRDNKPYDIEQF